MRFLPVAVVAILWCPTSKTSAKLKNRVKGIPQTHDKVFKKPHFSGLFSEKVARMCLIWWFFEGWGRSTMTKATDLAA